VVLAYGATLRFFAIEICIRPVLEDVARELPDEAQLGQVGVPLRWKLLAAVPLINVITGVVAAGLSGRGSSELADLGVDVLAAIAVASTISLELTLLLSRSVRAPIEDLRDATERVRRGDLSARVPVVSTDETGRLAQSFNRMAAGLEERERLREAFGAFVDPEVAERVLREGTLQGEDVEVSILFIDIRDFTAYAERSSAREVVERLNDFYGRVVPVLQRHGGHANKFVGDGLLAVFGAPDRPEDHADRALSAALEIADLVRAHYGDELRIGMGLNSGPVLAGTVGGGGRLDFTVIGDPVNTAARVEDATRATGDELLVTAATRALLTQDRCEFVERPAALLRGKTERVRLYAPVAPTEGRTPSDRGRREPGAAATDGAGRSPAHP
jgi:class 3 adenylate cyclase